MDLTITITEDDVVYLSAIDEEGNLVLVQRLKPAILRIEDYRFVKPKRWWNL